jgi:hypothetical protein
MTIVLTKEGFRSLRLAWALLGLAVLAAAALAWGSHLYLQKEQRDGLATQRELREAQTRLDAAMRERDDLKDSAEIFQDLVKRGILNHENRLDFVERLERLKIRHRLLGLEYEIAPQRLLPLPGGRVFNSVDVLGSRVKLKVLALHEGDALAFLEELANPPQGFNPFNRCALRKIDTGTSDALVPRAEADCTLEWISLKDKRIGRAN